jgi:hypothetical protein
MTRRPSSKLSRRLENMVKILLDRPLAGLLLILQSLGVKNATRLLDAKFKNTQKLLGVDTESASIESLTAIVRCIKHAPGSLPNSMCSIDSFLCSPIINKFVSGQRCSDLADLFNLYGSDKAKDHNYHRVYQSKIDSLTSHGPLLLSEIGLGTNNIDTPSNMGIYGSPVASARAFRDYNELVTVHAGDVDERILFTEARISTQKVDQLDIESLKRFIYHSRPALLIDDGLHTPRSNLNVFSAFVDFVISAQIDHSVWLIIEDICLTPKCISMWLALLSSLPSTFDAWLVESNISALAICRFTPLPPSHSSNSDSR